MDHPCIINGPLTSGIQTVYLVELVAFLHVIESANVPTRIVTNCQTVANQAFVIHDREAPALGGDRADLRNELTEIVRNKEHDFFEIEWVASHIDVEKALEVQEVEASRKNTALATIGGRQSEGTLTWALYQLPRI